jgi:hypothetical protein
MWLFAQAGSRNILGNSFQTKLSQVVDLLISHSKLSKNTNLNHLRRFTNTLILVSI